MEAAAAAAKEAAAAAAAGAAAAGAKAAAATKAAKVADCSAAAAVERVVEYDEHDRYSTANTLEYVDQFIPDDSPQPEDRSATAHLQMRIRVEDLEGQIHSLQMFSQDLRKSMQRCLTATQESSRRLRGIEAQVATPPADDAPPPPPPITVTRHTASLTVSLAVCLSLCRSLSVLFYVCGLGSLTVFVDVNFAHCVSNSLSSWV